VGPLGNRLVQMETELAKASRIPDAKVVRGYREALGETLGQMASLPSVVAGSMDGRPTSALQPPMTMDIKDGGTNSLGMKFIPVKGTDVLFCIHETRYKDYAVYAAEAEAVTIEWKNQSIYGFTPLDRPEDHPVINVSWDDAQKFCTWLSKKEGKLYRIPTDQEWSVAVGIARDEKWKSNTTPETVFKNKSEFPWGDAWPPPKPVGNYSDESRLGKTQPDNLPWLEGYNDSFPTTAPVMSFDPNDAGLYDMGGNVSEWVEDFYDSSKKERTLRGASWDITKRENLLSSKRHHFTPDVRFGAQGFRVVLDPTDR
jgi:hypothetical protein